MRVVPLHELIKGLLSEGKVFRLFTRPEGGVQAGYVEMPSQHMGAEAVYCGYVGPAYTLRRPVKPRGLVALLLSRQGGQPVPYALFHFGDGLGYIGVCKIFKHKSIGNSPCRLECSCGVVLAICAGENRNKNLGLGIFVRRHGNIFVFKAGAKNLSIISRLGQGRKYSLQRGIPCF